MKKYNLLFLFVALLAFTALAAVSCQRGPANTDTGDTETPADTGDTTSDITDTTGDTSVLPPTSGLENPVGLRSLLLDEKNKADIAVKTLQSDTVLQLVSLKFINSLSSQTGLATNYYIYSAISNPSFYYMVNAPRNGESFKRFLMPVEDLDLPFDLMPIPMQYWKLSYAEALSEAETRGGDVFRAKHPTFEASAILARPAGQYLSWFITYRATDSSGDMLKVAVDANSGTVTVI